MEAEHYINTTISTIITGTVDTHENIICVGTSRDHATILIKLDQFLNELHQYIIKRPCLITKITTDIETDNIFVIGHILVINQPFIMEFSPQLDYIGSINLPITGRLNDITVADGPIICVGETTATNGNTAGLLVRVDTINDAPLIETFDHNDSNITFRLVESDCSDTIAVIGLKFSETERLQILWRFVKDSSEYMTVALYDEPSVDIGLFNSIEMNHDDKFTCVGHALQCSDGKMYPRASIFDTKNNTVKLTKSKQFVILPPEHDRIDGVISVPTFTATMSFQNGGYAFGGYIRNIQIGRPDKYYAVICFNDDNLDGNDLSVIAVNNVIINDAVLCKQGLVIFGKTYDDRASEGIISTYTPDYLDENDLF